MALTTAEYLLLEQHVETEAPDVTTAYLLWFFLGLASGHRWYLGKPGTAVLQILSYCVGIGIVWWVIDGFLIPSMIRERQAEIRSRMLMTLSLISAGRAAGARS